jgi:thioredoxin reductase
LKLHYDMIVIGSGPAGKRAAIQAAKIGKKVLLIEKNEVVGGVTVHTGTIPSKTLRETVLFLSGWRQRGIYGRSYKVKDNITADDLKQRLTTTLGHEIEIIQHQLMRNGVEIQYGHARFIGEKSIGVEDHDGIMHDFTADYFVICVGTKTRRPDSVPFDGEAIMDSDEILKLSRIPKKLLVVGGGVIGLEYATIFKALDIEVTVLESNDYLLGFVDREIIDELIALCRKEERTRFEKELVEYEDETTIESELLNIKSAHLLGQGFLEAALKAMQEIPLVDQDNYGQFNPFVRRFKDCVNCLLPDSVTTYNRIELIELMLEMEFNARAAETADQAASIYFDLGEAFYNMSYFGQAWKATDLFRSSASASRAYRNKGQKIFSQVGLPLGNAENFDTDRARRYFDLARRTAKSKEIQVAAAYMAAKCERDDFYTKQERRTYDYFGIIETDYSDTQFYQRIINECRDFQAYLLK